MVYFRPQKVFNLGPRAGGDDYFPRHPFDLARQHKPENDNCLNESLAEPVRTADRIALELLKSVQRASLIRREALARLPYDALFGERSRAFEVIESGLKRIRFNALRE